MNSQVYKELTSDLVKPLIKPGQIKHRYIRAPQYVDSEFDACIDPIVQGLVAE